MSSDNFVNARIKKNCVMHLMSMNDKNKLPHRHIHRVESGSVCPIAVDKFKQLFSRCLLSTTPSAPAASLFSFLSPSFLISKLMQLHTQITDLNCIRNSFSLLRRLLFFINSINLPSLASNQTDLMQFVTGWCSESRVVKGSELRNSQRSHTSFRMRNKSDDFTFSA